MNAPLNRRAALGSLFAGATLAVPITAFAADPDLELLALQGRIDAADHQLDSALDALAVAEEEEALRRPIKPKSPGLDTPSAEAIRAFADRMAEIRAHDPRPEQVAYDEALTQWEQEKARTSLECGVDAAHTAEIAAHDAASELIEIITDTPAKTLAGLIFKAKYAAAHDFDEDVTGSIVADLLGMERGA